MAISNSTDRFNGVVASLAIKVRCDAGIEVNVPQLTGLNNPYDGFFLVDGDRALLTAQFNGIDNGIWVVNATGLWTRSADWDGSRDVEKGTVVFARSNSGGDDKLWQVTNPAGTIVPGNTAVTITQLVFGAGAASNLQDVTDVGNTTDNLIRFERSGVPTDFVEMGVSGLLGFASPGGNITSFDFLMDTRVMLGSQFQVFNGVGDANLTIDVTNVGGPVNMVANSSIIMTSAANLDFNIDIAGNYDFGVGGNNAMSIQNNIVRVNTDSGGLFQIRDDIGSNMNITMTTGGPTFVCAAIVGGDPDSYVFQPVVAGEGMSFQIAEMAAGPAAVTGYGQLYIKSGAAGDPFWSDVELLADMDGIDTATSYTEISDNGASMSFFGNAQLDTAQFNSGTASLLLDGTGDYATYPDIAAYNIGPLAWTIEGFVRFNTLPPLQASTGPGFVLYDSRKGGSALIQVGIIQDAFGFRVRLVGQDWGSEVGTISGGISTGVWYHWAVTRDVGGDDNVRAYFNGLYEVADFGVSPADLGNPDAPIYIGSRTGVDAYHDGWIDDVRVTIGTARYTGTGAYSVPTTPYAGAPFPNTINFRDDAGSEFDLAGGGGVTDHTALTSIGTNTHAQIDTHIADVSIHTEDALLAHLAGAETFIGNKNFEANMTLDDGSDLLAFSATAGVVIAQPTGGMNLMNFNIAVQTDNLEVVGAITVSGLVDGRDVDLDGTNQDNHIADGTIHFTQGAISIPASQISDFDVEVANNGAVTANTAKVTNATHSGQVTGSGALSLTVNAITDQAASGAVIGSDTMIINDGGLLREVSITQLSAFFGTGGAEVNDLSSVVTWANVPDANITQGSVTQHQAAINHDLLLNFTSTEHFTQGAISIPASQISDFDTEVSNNASVTANTGKVSNATHTGDVTGSVALTIAASAVANSMLEDMAGQTVKVRTGSTGAPQNLAVPVNTVLGRQGAAALTVGQVITDQITNDHVTYAKIQNVVSANRVLGSLSAAGLVTELTGTQINTFLPNFTTSLDGLAPSSGGGSTNYLRADGTWAAPPGAGGSLSGLTDTNITSVANGHLLMWDSTPGEWVNATTLVFAYTFSNLITFSADVSGLSAQAANDIKLSDSAAIGFGNGSGTTGDVRIYWDNTDLEIVGLSANQTINIRDGHHLRLWDSTDTDWLDIHNTGANIQLTELNLANIIFPAAGTFGINMVDNTIERPILEDYAIESVAEVVAANAFTLTYAEGPAFEADLELATGSVIGTLSGGPPSGTYGQITVKVTQDGTAARLLTWAGGTFRWNGGAIHPITTTLNGFSLYTFETWDGGANWYGAGADYS